MQLISYRYDEVGSSEPFFPPFICHPFIPPSFRSPNPIIKSNSPTIKP
jgi:hypothetical protein